MPTRCTSRECSRISQEILTRLGEGHPVSKIVVSAPGDDFEYAFG